METKKIRLLNADEIECRVGSGGKSNSTWCTILLYKDARVDMRMLDEVFGAANWKRTHELINGNLYCTVSVWDDAKKEWVGKQDVGVESMTEKEKGQASDAFKRACFNWGIGRELYTAPLIYINLSASEYGNDGRLRTRFTLKEIAYSDKGEISHLVIVDGKGTERYRFDSGRSSSPKVEQSSVSEEKKALILSDIKTKTTRDEMKKLWNDCKDLQKEEWFMQAVTAQGKTIGKAN